MKKEALNILICGVGGEGILTLKKILGFVAIKEKENFLASELHGLSQRQGSVTVHFRVGKEIFSPLIEKEKADLILSLDLYEAKRNYYFASPKTIFVVNDYLVPFLKESETQIKKFLKQNFKKVYFLKAYQISQKEFGNKIFGNILLLGYLVEKNLLPFKKQSFNWALKKVFKKSEIYLKNKLAFDFAKKVVKLNKNLCIK